MTYRVVFTKAAVEMLTMGVSSRKDLHAILRRIDEVAENPETLGKPLVKELAGFWSSRAGGQRYRILYRLDIPTHIMWIVALGIRREGDSEDIYEVAKKLHQKHELDEGKPAQ